MESSNSLFQRALQSIPGGVNSPVRAFKSVGGNPFFTASADGAFLRTTDGRDLIDFVGTWGPAIHGHNDPDIRQALAKALTGGTSFGTPHPGEVEMAELIRKTVPSVEKVRMCNSGTEANLSTIRLARGATGRSRIVKFDGCYHGHVDSLLVAAGSGAMTLGQPDSAGIPEELARLTTVLPFNNPEAVNNCFENYSDAIAAVIVEPYPANSGFYFPEENFLELLRSRCTEHGAVLIFDEVMTGFRLHPAGVQGLTGIQPDLSAFGKVIGGGLPVGAFGGDARIMDYLAPEGPVYQAGTLSGNPLALAAGLTSVNKLLETDAYTELERKGLRIATSLRQAAEERGIPLTVHQSGSMFCLFFHEGPIPNASAVQQSDFAAFNRFFHCCLEQGVYLPPSAYETCFISTAHTDAIIDQALEIMTRALDRA